MYNPGEISKFGDASLPPWEWNVRQGGTFNKEVMIKNVLDFKIILDRNNISFCVMFGTLLGFVRDGDIIQGDSDFDIFCFSKDYIKWNKVKKQLKDENFYIPEDVPFNDDYIIRNGEKIDINWVMPFGRYYVYNNEIYYPKEYFEPLNEVIQIWGTPFRLPNNCSRLLEDLYGNWKVPSKNKGRINIYPKC